MKKFYYIGIFILIISCNNGKCIENYVTDTSCFENFREMDMTLLTKEIDFSKKVNCFEWDSLEVGKRGSYKNYICMKFHQIYKTGREIYLGKDLESHMNWFDVDRDWTFIYFYKNGTILNDVLAIPKPHYFFEELKKNNESNSFRKKKISDI